MIERVVSKACRQMTVRDLLNRSHDLKVLNFTSAGVSTWKLDRQCIVDTNTKIDAGEVLILADAVLLVGHKQGDYFRGRLIRYTLDCVEANNKVTVIRQIPASNTQGGISGHTDSTIHTALPCKVGHAEDKLNRELDVDLIRYSMLVSSRYAIEINDTLIFDHGFTASKVQGITLLSSGLSEVTLSRDTRWQ